MKKTLHSLSSRTLKTVAVIFVLFLASCGDSKNPPEAISQIDSLYSKLIVLKGSSATYIEARERMAVLSKNSSPTESDKSEMANLNDFLENNRRTSLITRDDINGYVSAMKNLAGNIRDSTQRNYYLEQLAQISPGFNSSTPIIEAIGNLAKMADTCIDLKGREQHFQLLASLLVYKSLAGGI